jgi:xylan 1,4-beta-xylosidase
MSIVTNRYLRVDSTDERPLRGARLNGDMTLRRPFGRIRLHALPASGVWHARTSVELCAVEPHSTATVRLGAAGLKCGDVAGLALSSAMALAPEHRGSGLSEAKAAFNAHFAGRTTRPYAWLGVQRGRDGFALIRFIEHSGRTSRLSLDNQPVWLRAECDFSRNEVGFCFSTDGTTYVGIGESHPMGDRPGAGLVMWCSLFSCATSGHAEGGHADFDSLLLTTSSLSGARLRPGRSNPAGRARDQRRTRVRSGRSRDS